jgi:hypothetical protein
MNEWIYVLTVEELVFGLLGTLVTTQSLDVFTWPEDETWPVCGTSILAILAYSLSLLVICSVITASWLGSLAEDVCHSFSRSAGRLVTVAGLWVIVQSTVVYVYDRRDWQLLLCQLWGTTCKDPVVVLWAYDDCSFIVLTETKFRLRCIPVWDLYSPHLTRVEKSTCDNALTMTSLVHW